MFTTNLVKGAPVIWTKKVVKKGIARAIVVNSGNANTCNGPQGLADATRMAHLTAELNNLSPEQVIVSSTGVIGMPLDMAKVEAGIEMATKALSRDGGPKAALAIMTTDTKPKEIALKLELSTGSVCIGGMAKGSGMIHPNMATMLAFITTDAAVDHNTLQTLLRRAVDKSFNMLSVDGDTSTNDMVIVLANGASGVAVTSEADLSLFEKGLTHVCVELTKMIARDGEGATKLIEIRVTGARTEADARKIARAISTSISSRLPFTDMTPTGAGFSVRQATREPIFHLTKSISSSAMNRWRLRVWLFLSMKMRPKPSWQRIMSSSPWISMMEMRKRLRGRVI